MNDIISRLAALVAIKNCESGDSFEYNEGLIAAMNAVVDTPTAQEWISTKKRYPLAGYGEGEDVLTVDSVGDRRVLYFDGRNWCWPNGKPLLTSTVFPITHWMPFPEPPKEE